jgi:methoxymalonate biosynthesis acyl carrier protein
VTEVQILETLKTYFAKEQGAKDLGPEDSLLSSGVLDSLAIVKLLSFLEDEFDVEIDDADFDPENFENLRSIVKLVANEQN